MSAPHFIAIFKLLEENGSITVKHTFESGYHRTSIRCGGKIREATGLRRQDSHRRAVLKHVYEIDVFRVLFDKEKDLQEVRREIDNEADHIAKTA